ncbi:uncharacterized protein LOC125727266 isoform X2 [Brienomyrus brachyistius]|uniref:uncharacterized protein LOC125727266 isoform X2 n=1 Tax=Brienomyrus brachyistius TaxID=42636 RepID=UPI0020B2969D|nr:uncharacterized protein LOC125727266 isoform X2 [Brienomyrus brachyistius]
MMADPAVAFQSQLASIMEVLVRNAVCEITRLYEKSMVELQSVLAQSESEKASLKLKLQQSEKASTLPAGCNSSAVSGAESHESLAHVDTVVKQEDTEADMKIDTFCTVCGKMSRQDSPFCEACWKTMQFPSHPSEGSIVVTESSRSDRAGGASLDIPKCLDLNVFEADTEEFPRLFEPKPFCSLSPTDVSDKCLAAPETCAVPSDSHCSARHSPAKRPRLSSEVDGTSDSMAAEAKELVQAILARRPGGDRVIQEYRAKGTLTDTTRRHLINLLVAHMTETQGTSPPKNVRELYALGIISLFPSLKDPFSQNGYEHFYDGRSGTGYLAWRLKTVQRKGFHRNRGSQKNVVSRGPDFVRQTQPGEQLHGDCLLQAISALARCTDREQVLLKMRETFQYRQQLVHDPQKAGAVLSTFPRLLDTKGLVNQDFTLLFGLETSCKLLESWTHVFKAKVIKEAKCLTQSADLSVLLRSAEHKSDGPWDLPEDQGWDSDMASMLLLVHLLPPPAGRRKSAKISAREAVDRMVQFQELNSRPEPSPRVPVDQRQPFLVAVGRRKDQIQSFFIALDGRLLPCQAGSSLGAFDELFKAHFVFGLTYDEALSSVYTFLQTTIYHIDVGSVKESPRVKELRARLLNNC